ncbi:Fic family protein [Chitinophaga polysaccharea]|uniref:Fic family protein n=1 Tax=Chitinophaga polysaccharea TaxID=1293035 RepID=UPI0011572DE4|nr:Fic family protein [Chitinophaga polysaccharea]
MYIHQQPGWPGFKWDAGKLADQLAEVRFRQGKILGYMESLGFDLQTEASLQTLTLDVLKSSEIEGEILDTDQVRSSIARRLGIDIASPVYADREVEGVVEMMMDATQRYESTLNDERLFSWHAALFPTGRSGMRKIITGAWRNNPDTAPMQVVSGPYGKEKVHYEAPAAGKLSGEMNIFLEWFNRDVDYDPIIKAAIVHLWFVTIHPFDDGNGRIARAIADMQLARSDNNNQRFYSMSAQIRKDRNAYYAILEKTQKGKLDITGWIEWFLACLHRAMMNTDDILVNVLKKARFWKEHKDASFNERQRNILIKLLDGFTGKLTSSKWAKITKCSSDTAVRDINDLVQKGVLKKEDAGGRSTSYVLV